MSPPSHEGLNTSKTEPKSPNSVYESSVQPENRVKLILVCWLGCLVVCVMFTCVFQPIHFGLQ